MFWEDRAGGGKKFELSTGCRAVRLVDATGHKHMLIIIVGQQKRDVEVDHTLPGAAWYCCRLLVLTPTGAATISFRRSLWEFASLFFAWSCPRSVRPLHCSSLDYQLVLSIAL